MLFVVRMHPRHARRVPVRQLASCKPNLAIQWGAVVDFHGGGIDGEGVPGGLPPHLYVQPLGSLTLHCEIAGLGLHLRCSPIPPFR